MNSKKKINLRDEFPEIAARIDELRAAFGKAPIDAQIKKGMRGEPTFCVRQNGLVVVGTPIFNDGAVGIMWDARGISYAVDIKPGKSEYTRSIGGDQDGR